MRCAVWHRGVRSRPRIARYHLCEKCDRAQEAHAGRGRRVVARLHRGPGRDRGNSDGCSGRTSSRTRRSGSSSRCSSRAASRTRSCRRSSAGSRRRCGLHLRAATAAVSTAWVVYATGWGSILRHRVRRRDRRPRCASRIARVEARPLLERCRDRRAARSRSRSDSRRRSCGRPSRTRSRSRPSSASRSSPRTLGSSAAAAEQAHRADRARPVVLPRPRAARGRRDRAREPRLPDRLHQPRHRAARRAGAAHVRRAAHPRRAGRRRGRRHRPRVRHAHASPTTSRASGTSPTSSRSSAARTRA